MATMNLDFSNVANRDPLPEGVYDVAIAKVEQTTSKAGNPMLKIEFNVLTEGYEKRKLWTNYVLTQAAMWKLKELLDALGMDTSAIVDLDTDELIGMTCSAKVTQREYEGNIQNEIKKVM